MFLLFLVQALANITLRIKPKEFGYCLDRMGKEDIGLLFDLYRLDNHKNVLIRFSEHFILGDPNDLKDFKPFEKSLKDSFEKVGAYFYTIYNGSDKDILYNGYSNPTKAHKSEDKDINEVKKLFSDIESKLLHLYNSNMKLKTIQDTNILEAKRVVNILYIMFIVPVVYLLVGFAKLKAVKMMFAPKKNLKP